MRKDRWLALALLVAGCETNSETPARGLGSAAPYFALNTYLETQARLLQREAAAARKQVQLRTGGQETTLVAKPDWRQELQIFQQADLTKPALRGSYRVDSMLAGGILQRRYTPKAGVQHPVRQLTVELAGPQVVRITAIIRQDNPLVYSTKNLELHSSQGRLSSYHVTGVQKLVLFDSVRYAVHTQVQ